MEAVAQWLTYAFAIVVLGGALLWLLSVAVGYAWFVITELIYDVRHRKDGDR